MDRISPWHRRHLPDRRTSSPARTGQWPGEPAHRPAARPPSVPATARGASARPSSNLGEPPIRPAWKIPDQLASYSLLAPIGRRYADGPRPNRMVVEQSRPVDILRMGYLRMGIGYILREQRYIDSAPAHSGSERQVLRFREPQ